MCDNVEAALEAGANTLGEPRHKYLALRRLGQGAESAEVEEPSSSMMTDRVAGSSHDQGLEKSVARVLLHSNKARLTKIANRDYLRRPPNCFA